MSINNEALIHKYFEEVWNKGNLKLLDEIIDSDYINHNPAAPDTPPGPDGLRPIIEGIRQGFPDLRYEIKNIVASNNQVAVHTIMYGTHTGNLFGINPTNKKVEVPQMQIEKISNGKIIEHWRVTDELIMQRQLGLITE